MADFYSTLVAADAYHLARGNTAWAAGLEDNKNAAMLRGSEYIDQAYRTAFPGYKTDLRAQLREWPRVDAYDDQGNYLASDAVPVEAFDATYEAALRELANPGSLLPDYLPTGQKKRVKVDVIDITYELPNGAQASLPVISVINRILAPILTASTNTSALGGRAVRT